MLGEFIGTFFEDLMKGPIRKFAQENNFYFDSYGYREARHADKIKWEDVNGSHHDLDYVIEKGGTEYKIGTPVAFIELAWRRYTKHSKNKAQEIQAALNPICAKYQLEKPFKGVILSGVFTQPSLDQLANDNFHILYFPFEQLVEAFKIHGIDIFFDEDTSEKEFKLKVDKLEEIKKSNPKVLNAIGDDLKALNAKQISKFLDELNAYCTRVIDQILILPLHGTTTVLKDVSMAISFINNYDMSHQEENLPLRWFEIMIKYTNGTSIDGKFNSKQAVIDFLNRMK